MSRLIETKDIRKTYFLAEEVHAVDGISISIETGEFVAIMGASGSGKSTFMNLIGCLDKATSGEYYLDGVETSGLEKNELADIRNHKIGFIFQGLNLIPRTSAIDNVLLPLFYDRRRGLRNPTAKAKLLLEKVGLKERMQHEPSQLSGGQQQRVAIARALVNDPAIILADEPTGNLDSKTSIELMAIFQKLNDENRTILMVTHERDIARYAKRVVELKDGKVLKDYMIQERANAENDLEVLRRNSKGSSVIEVI